MTPEELRSVADEATRSYPNDGPDYQRGVRSRQWLTDCAPDLARLCAELGEALEACLQSGVDEDDVKWIAVDPRGVRPAQAALAKLSELEPHA